MSYQKRQPDWPTRVFRYKLRPSEEQAAVMEETLETLRRLYNRALWERTALGLALRFAKRAECDMEALAWDVAWLEAQGKDALILEAFGLLRDLDGLPEDERAEGLEALKAERSAAGQRKRLITAARREDEYLARVNVHMAQDCLARLDRAFQAFYRRLKAGERPGYPRFKRRGEYDTAGYAMVGSGCHWKPNPHAPGQFQPVFQHIGPVRVLNYHRPLPEGALLRLMSWSRRADGWWLQVTIQEPAVEHRPGGEVETSVGLFVGLKPFVTTSEGDTIQPLSPYGASLNHLRARQRKKDRCDVQNARLAQMNQEIRRLHLHVAEQRENWHIHMANDLLGRYRLIVHEALPVSQMIRRPAPVRGESGGYASNGAKATTPHRRRMADNGWSQFFSILRQQAPKYGARVVAVPVQEGRFSGRAEHAQAVLLAGLEQDVAGEPAAKGRVAAAG